MKKFEITKEQLQTIEPYYSAVKEWFADAFKKELEVGKWYKGNQCLFYVVGFERRYRAYGFNIYNEWTDESDGWNFNNLTEATPQEVEAALICEWERRGGKKGVIFNTPTNSFQSIDNGIYYFIKPDNFLYSDGFAVFNNGKWATIIETITKEEAEKLLNKKIV